MKTNCAYWISPKVEIKERYVRAEISSMSNLELLGLLQLVSDNGSVSIGVLPDVMETVALARTEFVNSGSQKHYQHFEILIH